MVRLAIGSTSEFKDRILPERSVRAGLQGSAVACFFEVANR